MLLSCLWLCWQEYSPAAVRRDSKWSTRGCFRIRWQEVLIQRQEIEKNMRVAFKYSFPIYTELQKIFRIAPQFSGLDPATSSLSWPLLALRQPKVAGGPCLQAANVSLSPTPQSSTGQTAEYCALEPRWCALTGEKFLKWGKFSSQSYSCRMKVEVHRTKYSDLYCFVCKAAVTGAYFDKKVCHRLGYTQSHHAWSQSWRAARSPQGIPSGGKQLSDVLLPTHHKNSTMLPKKCAMLLLSGHSGHPQDYAISSGFTCLPASIAPHQAILLRYVTKGMTAAYVFTQRYTDVLEMWMSQ